MPPTSSNPFRAVLQPPAMRLATVAPIRLTTTLLLLAAGVTATSAQAAAPAAAPGTPAVPAPATDTPDLVIKGWEEDQHWPGPGVTPRFNGREMTVKYEGRRDLTFYVSDPVAFAPRRRPHLIIKADLEEGVTADLVAKTPGDVAGRFIGATEDGGWKLLRFELCDARKEFSQVTLRLSADKGAVIIAGARLVEGPAAPVLTPAVAPTTPALKFEKTGLAPLFVPGDAAKWPARREELRRLWLTALGPSPDARPALDVEWGPEEEFEDYTRRRLRFRSEGDEFVSGWLLTPRTGDPAVDGAPADEKAGKPARPPKPRPAVVCLHPTNPARSDEMVGLSSRGAVAHGLHLVKAGYVTFSYDCYILGAGTTADGGLPKNVALTRTEELKKRRPEWTGLGKMTWDASRAVDFLESLPAVDKSRIGVIGHSLGAKQALFAAAFDTRYAACVFSEGGVGLTHSNWTDPWYLGAAMKPRIGELDNHQVLALVAPRPVLILGGDSADGDKTRPYVDEAGAVWRLLGRPDGVTLFNHKQGHSFPLSAASEAYRFLDLHLKPAGKE